MSRVGLEGATSTFNPKIVVGVPGRSYVLKENIVRKLAVLSTRHIEHIISVDKANYAEGMVQVLGKPTTYLLHTKHV